MGLSYFMRAHNWAPSKIQRKTHWSTPRPSVEKDRAPLPDHGGPWVVAADLLQLRPNRPQVPPEPAHCARAHARTRQSLGRVDMVHLRRSLLSLQALGILDVVGKS